MLAKLAYDNLFSTLSEHTTIITPNRRLSATLHQLYHQYQLSNHHTCWTTPDILPLSAWIQRLWHQASHTNSDVLPLILSPEQEHLLWENIVAATQNDLPLLQIAETADIVKSAWSLLIQWNIDICSPEFDGNEDNQALRRWMRAFADICQKKNWTTEANIPSLLRQHAGNQLILIGFTEISPSIQSLLQHYQSSSVHLALDSAAHRISLDDRDTELTSMARWAKSVMGNNRRIGCVIPALDKQRDRVNQLFAEVLDDHDYNISAGKPLLSYPIINMALRLLSLNNKQVSLESLSQLLHSPFLGDAETERFRRANAEYQLRRDNVNTITLPHAAIEKHCLKLHKRLIGFLSLIDQCETKNSHSNWAGHFNRLLTTLGWPGERSLSSQEYQIINHWLQLQNEFSRLDQVSAPITYQAALQTLQKMAARSVFQPKTPDAPIQVLGLLEAAGLPFDYIWIAGMDDVYWPPQPKPHPLIPKRLQRLYQMPHATAERELFFCQQLTQQFMQNAKHLIFSHVLNEDHLERQPSSLIRHLPEWTLNDLALPTYHTKADIIHASSILEILKDDHAPAISNTNTISGGVSVLKQQALCPFKAFTEWRLHARELEDPTPGLRAKDRGSVLHKILEIIWLELQDHATLVHLTDEALSALIDQSVHTAMTTFSFSETNKTRYLTLEKERLAKLAKHWLQLEKQRPPFTVVANEQTTDITIDQLSLSIRIDRIDKLNTGQTLMIDYKTGKNNDINRWFGARPDEPQLPVYLINDANNAVGITYAQIASGEYCFKGIAGDDIDIPGIQSFASYQKSAAPISWHEQIEQWRLTITKLGHDFHQGIATVDPKDAGKTCEWCKLQPVCRIKEEMTHDE